MNRQSQCRKCKGMGPIIVKKKLEECPICDGLGFYPWVDPAFE